MLLGSQESLLGPHHHMEQASAVALSGCVPECATTLCTHPTKSTQKLAVMSVFWSGQAQLFSFMTVLENW